MVALTGIRASGDARTCPLHHPLPPHPHTWEGPPCPGHQGLGLTPVSLPLGFPGKPHDVPFLTWFFTRPVIRVCVASPQEVLKTLHFQHSLASENQNDGRYMSSRLVQIHDVCNTRPNPVTGGRGGDATCRRRCLDCKKCTTGGRGGHR